jgi:4-carboxymuconolactone decarboxylase
MSAIDAGTAALVRLAALVDAAQSERLAAEFRLALKAGAPPAWLDELVLTAVLFAGFPRALVAAGALRTVVPEPGDAGDAASYNYWPDWMERGEAVCRIIYGKRYDALRHNVKQLHPALDAWIVMDGYGRTISRPALDLARRELCAVAMLIPQNVPRQLHSHLHGSLNAGATLSQVEQVIDLAIDASGCPADRATAARRMWQDIRNSVQT